MNFKTQFPKIGARNLKSALAIVISIIIAEIFSFDTAFYAAITSVACMQDSSENSIHMGKNRFVGTVIGAIFGSIGTLILSINNNFILKIALIFILSASTIYICTLVKLPGAVTIACIVLLGTLLLNRDFSNYYYAFHRSVETFVGAIIAIVVNHFVFPHKKDFDITDTHSQEKSA
ncbi:MAG: FUSC family protein [Sarcina sp.]